MRRIGYRRPAAIALAGAGVLATVAAGTTATWTFLPGGEITAHNMLNLNVENIDTGAVVTCDDSTSTSTAKSGTGLSGEDLVAIDAISFSHTDNGDGECNGPGGLLVRVTALALPWRFQAQSYDVIAGTVKGKVTGVVAKGEGSDGCELELGGPGGQPGAVGLSYQNSNGQITIEDGLGGLDGGYVQDGDPHTVTSP
ncbi:hypothetical protein ACH35V_07600 [Actinomadura sp. 1N219]|uniref:hypothetical protein n=1 Tax=Actinomadura sp. 1N219 TaxID=3375152 RepID=UPI0037A84879